MLKGLSQVTLARSSLHPNRVKRSQRSQHLPAAARQLRTRRGYWPSYMSASQPPPSLSDALRTAGQGHLLEGFDQLSTQQQAKLTADIKASSTQLARVR